MIRILEALQGEALLLQTAYRREGFTYVLREGIIHVFRWPINIFSAFYYRHLRRRRPTFAFQGQTYHYFYHSYNNTWKNERSLEVPIVWRLVEEHRGKRILEVGNVLRHYFPCQHDVVDLFEKYPGVINKDIVDFRPSQKYDLVVSISTFEHFGWDRRPRDPEKILAALRNLVEHVVAPGGKIIITVPLGYNADLDRLLVEGKIHFTSMACLKRTSLHSQEWRETAWDEIHSKEFSADGKWLGADRVLIIGTVALQ